MSPLPQATPTQHALAQRYTQVRAQTESLAAPLSEADCQPQSMPDASPVKWHLAHVTWFFETFVLEPHEAGFVPFHPAFRVLFNSYYNAVGAKHPRPQRGLVTRPGLAEVLRYRHAVDERLLSLLARAEHDEALAQAIEPLVTLGLHHEQQHQELILTDLKHLLSLNPLQPAYQPRWPLAPVAAGAGPRWLGHEGGLATIGHDEANGFAFDNEGPRHAVFLRPYEIGAKLVTHGDWVEFVEDAGYRDPRWWLSAGWDWVQQQSIEAPLYWRREDQGFSTFTLHGRCPLDPHTPIVHVSLYEADAYARWRAAADPACHGARLPTEAEWEHAAAPVEASAIAEGLFLDSGALHPMPPTQPSRGDVAADLFGQVWQWTSSAYLPYPGYRPWAGAVGEYNGKFMIDQTVLRGGSCASPRSHLRASYRNFFPAATRWQFAGLRLARDL